MFSELPRDPGVTDEMRDNIRKRAGTVLARMSDISERIAAMDAMGVDVQVLSASTGFLVASVPRPNPDSLGLDSSVVVTNAVAVDEDLLFISNGEAGVYLAQGGAFFSTTGSEAAQPITMVGRLRFGNLQSVNHVAYQGRYLIIAAGRGGLKIVQVI